MRINPKKWQGVMGLLDRLILGMCLVYGLLIIFMYLRFGGILPCFLDPLVMGLLILLLGIYPLARKRGLERMKKGKRIF